MTSKITNSINNVVTTFSYLLLFKLKMKREGRERVRISRIADDEKDNIDSESWKKRRSTSNDS